MRMARNKIQYVHSLHVYINEMKLLNLKESIKVAAETQFLMKTQTF